MSGSMIRVGIVGGGQLARMMFEDRPEGLDVSVLATESDESALDAGAPVTLVPQIDRAALLAFSRNVDIVTFDFELPNLDDLHALESARPCVFPDARAVSFADKAIQRRAFGEAGIPVPGFAIAATAHDAAAFGERFGWPVVAKLPTGGYDGRGVFMCENIDEVTRLLAQCSPLVIEEHLSLATEAACVLVRSVSGQQSRYPIVETVQRDGICVEVRQPALLDDLTLERANTALDTVDALTRSIGVMAVELFVTDEEVPRVLVNEIAPRPHNSGHITRDACATSQFENHLRAIAGLDLGPTNANVKAAVSLNVLGPQPGERPLDWNAALDAYVHRYGKSPRPGRKVGHITGTGATVEMAERQARQAHKAVTGRKEPW